MYVADYYEDKMIFPKRHLLLVAMLSFVLIWQTTAQENEHIVLSLLLPEMMQALELDATFSDFEAAHPNVKVHVIYETFQVEDMIPDTTHGIDEQALSSYP